MYDIMIPELPSLTAADRALKVGDLCVFQTYNNKRIGGRIARMWTAGEISNTAQTEVQVIGDHGCYKNGAKFTVDSSIVLAAV